MGDAASSHVGLQEVILNSTNDASSSKPDADRENPDSNLIRKRRRLAKGKAAARTVGTDGYPTGDEGIALLEDGASTSDLEVKCEEQVWMCHRDLLCKRSEYFRVLCGFEEKVC